MANYAKRDYKLGRIPIGLEQTLKNHPRYGGKPFVESLRCLNTDLKKGLINENEAIVRLEKKFEEMLYGKKKK